MIGRQQTPQVVPEYSVVTPLIEPHAYLPEIALIIYRPTGFKFKYLIKWYLLILHSVLHINTSIYTPILPLCRGATASHNERLAGVNESYYWEGFGVHESHKISRHLEATWWNYGRAGLVGLAR